MGYVKRQIDITKTENHEHDKDVDSGMIAVLTYDDKFQYIKIMGPIVHPLFQRKISMVDSCLCTETRYKSGCSGVLGRMARYFEGRGEYPVFLLVLVEKDEYDEVRDIVAISPYA